MNTALRTGTLALLLCVAWPLAAATTELAPKPHHQPKKHARAPKAAKPRNPDEAGGPPEAHNPSPSAGEQIPNTAPARGHGAQIVEEKANVQAAPNPERTGPSPRAAVVSASPRASVVFEGSPKAKFVHLQPEAEAVWAAYLALSRAERPYGGHRYRAMRETAIAGDLLGIHLRGDGTGRESQAESDAQILAAGGLLRQADDRALRGKHPEIAGHLAEAVLEIDAALASVPTH